MSFVSECDALIIDLRYNPGGEEKMVRNEQDKVVGYQLLIIGRNESPVNFRN